MRAAVLLLLLLAAPTAAVEFAPPVLAEHVAPDAPGAVGRVVLRLLVDADGYVASAVVVTGLDADTDAACAEAAMRLRFSPGMADGVPVPVEVEFAYVFEGRPAPRPQASLDGIVLDGRGQPVDGAEVTIGEQSTRTGADGRFTFPAIAPGDVTVIVGKEGGASTIRRLTLRDGEALRVEAMLAGSGIGESVVFGREAWIEVERAPLEPPEGAVVGRWELTSRDVSLAAGATGDVGKALTKLPGVSGDTDLFATFRVRGGDARETTVLLDGVLLPTASQLGGAFTAFDPAIASRIVLHTAAQPPSIGESLSGALEVSYRDPDTSQWDGAFDINMAMASLHVSGPLGRPGADAGFLLSGRTSFLEPYMAVMAATGVLGDARFGIRFGEYLGRLAFVPSPRHRFRLTVRYAHDRLRLDSTGEDALLRIEHGLDIRARTVLTAFDWDFTVGRSHLRQLLALTADDAWKLQEGDFAVARHVTALRPMWKSTVDIALPANLRFMSGLELAYRSLGGDGTIKDPRAVPTWIALPWVNLGAHPLQFEANSGWTELALHTELVGEGIGDGPLDARIGVRGTIASPVGPFVSPRAAVGLRFGKGTALKVTGAVVHQVPDDPLVFDPLVGGRDLRPERALQVAAAFEQLLPFGALVRVEGWAKKLDHLLVNPDTRAALAAGRSYESTGSGTAMGLDAFFGFRAERVSAVVSYSLSRAQRTNPLNTAGPQRFEPFFDQRHALKVGGQVTIGPRDELTISANWELRAGRPRTPVTFVRTGDDWLAVPYDYDGKRYPAYTELSVRFESRRLVVGKAKLSFYVDVINATFAQSPLIWIYGQGDTDEDGRARPPRAYVLRQLPIRPWIGFRAEF
jgi:hypothetical protein